MFLLLPYEEMSPEHENFGVSKQVNKTRHQNRSKNVEVVALRCYSETCLAFTQRKEELYNQI